MANVIKVDTAKVGAALLARIPTKDDKARMLKGLGAAAMHYWKKKAKDNLKSTSRDYVMGLQEDIGAEKAVITLTGTLPNLIERGFQGGDMRKFMLDGPQAKVAKAGHKYLVVPFQHGTPGTTGRNVGGAMPPVIHNAAKQLKASVSRPGPSFSGSGRTVSYGERLQPEHHAVKRKAREILNRKEKPWHATSVYRSMIREAKVFRATGVRAKQGKLQTTGFQTFRVLSEKVIRGARDSQTGEATEHWFHPGMRARRFARDTRKYVREIATDIMASSVNHVGK